MLRSQFRRGKAGRSARGLWGLLLLGCASPGPPRPPSLHLPGQAEKVEAHRVGGEVQLTWLTPADTTDGEQVRGQITALICREVSQSGMGSNPRPGTCDVVDRVPVKPGLTKGIDVLPPNLTTGAAKLMAYRVELLNDRGRSAGRADAVYAAGGQAPAPAGPLTITARREAALIQWQPAVTIANATMELSRTITAVAEKPLTPSAGRDAGSGRAPRLTAGTARRPSSKAAGKDQTRTTTLTSASPARNDDPGGMLDPTVHDTETYVYVAQRVAKVTLAGHELELRGTASPPAQFVYRDTFPPPAPVALVSVPGGGFRAPPTIDLSWEPNPESDLLGYNVYRREGAGAFEKLTPHPVQSSAFRDLEVVPGRRYIYRVTAVDRRNNESPPSTEVSENLRP